MTKTKRPNHVSEVDGYRVEWRRRRGYMDADVYGPDQDPKTDDPLGELDYPTIPHTLGNVAKGGGYDQFAVEAVTITKRNEEKGVRN